MKKSLARPSNPTVWCLLLAVCLPGCLSPEEDVEPQGGTDDDGAIETPSGDLGDEAGTEADEEEASGSSDDGATDGMAESPSESGGPSAAAMPCSGGTGDEGCECYGNQTCNGELICLSDRCVDASSVDGQGEGGSDEPAEEGSGGNSGSEAANDPSESGDGSGETDEGDGLGSALSEALGGGDGDQIAPASEELGMTPASVGQPCESDADCGEGVTCLIEDSAYQEGSVAGGYCTFRCEQDPASCGATAACFGVGQDTEDDATDDIGYCYELCLFTDQAVKCAGSLNRVCTLIDTETGVGVCDPMCFSDAECPDGLVCSPTYPFTCVQELPPGLLPDGATCTTNEECAGGGCLFIEEASMDGICTSNCSQQAESSACRRDLGDATAADSVCFPLLPLVAQGIYPGENDLGQCLPPCDPADGCGHPEWTCVDLEDEDYTADIGFVGLCLPNLLLEGLEAEE